MAPRAVLGLVPLLALSLAGCVTQSALDPSALPPLAAPLRFLPAVAMDQPSAGAEPNIAVAQDGALFIAAVAGSQERPNALEGAAWLWRSQDDGASWETLRAPVRETPLGSLPMTRRPFGSSDADVIASPDGWVYYTDWWNWGIPLAGVPVASSRYGSYLVEASSDGGATWSSAPVTTLDSLNGVDRQWLVAGPDGFVGLFYAYFHGLQNTVRTVGDLFGRSDFIMSVQAVYSFDHGATWTNPVTVVDPVPDRSYQIAHPMVLADGTLVMPFGNVGPGTDFWHNPSSVRVAVSENNGASWFLRTVADVPEGFDNLWAVQGAADSAGTIYVAWAARAGENMTLFEAHSADEGLTWTAPRALRSAGLNFLPWVAAHAPGHVAVGWYGGDAQGKPEEAGDDAAWFAYVAQSRDGGAAWSVAKVSDEPVKVGALCPKGAACTANRELLDYVSLAYAPDGRLHVAFVKSRELDGGVKAGLVHYAGASG
ncbi:MAG TPA: sialidase family protein [Candidatus Thermoplasmatota archaeon]|jgi:hypothetical protein|nr:sialidase family protein [Candidatus Thermoplasmatota archaeon]